MLLIVMINIETGDVLKDVCESERRFCVCVSVYVSVCVYVSMCVCVAMKQQNNAELTTAVYKEVHIGILHIVFNQLWLGLYNLLEAFYISDSRLNVSVFFLPEYLFTSKICVC